MSADHLLERLERVRRTGPDRWLARCPAHQDRRPSLSIREGDDDKTLVHCFAGCSVEDIVAAARIDITDLFPPRAAAHGVKGMRRPVPVRDLIAALKHELIIAYVVLSDVANDKPIGEMDRVRVDEAQRRIAKFLHELEHA